MYLLSFKNFIYFIVLYPYKQLCIHCIVIIVFLIQVFWVHCQSVIDSLSLLFSFYERRNHSTNKSWHQRMFIICTNCVLCRVLLSICAKCIASHSTESVSCLPYACSFLTTPKPWPFLTTPTSQLVMTCCSKWWSMCCIVSGSFNGCWI